MIICYDLSTIIGGVKMKNLLKHVRCCFQFFILVLVVCIANISTSVEENYISNDASNRIINLSTMALKLEEDIKNDLYSAKDTFTGDITGYGADCPLCVGTLACKPSYYVKDGTTLYPDLDYGNVRIVASSKNLPCGSIVRFSLSKISSEPVIAIVLDRGVLGNDLDLLVENNNLANTLVGRNTLSYDILRTGWTR